MRALTWQATNDVQVREVPDPRIEQPTDAVIRVTSTAICGSDLHLYGVLSAYLSPGDVLGHEFMGVVEEVGSAVTGLQPGDRVVVPFNISCGSCWMCSRGLFAQCETTQNTDSGTGASLFGFSSLYGQVPGGQAEFVRVPHADFGPIKITGSHPDERYLFLSDILPTAWQGVQWADVPEGGSLCVIGLGPVGLLAVRAAKYLGIEHVIGVDLVPDRLDLARRSGADIIDLTAVDSVGDAVRDLTGGRGADAALDAVGMEAHGNPVSEAVIKGAARLPEAIGRPVIEKVGIDRLAALTSAIDAVRRGGTVSVSGVYGGAADPMPMMTMFDKGLALRMGQCHVKQWTPDLLEIADRSDDVLGLETLTTHHARLDEAPEMYRLFRDKQDGCRKVVLTP